MAGYIPKEQLQAYTRWEADSFDAPPPRPPAPEPQDAPPPEPESIPLAQIPLPTAEDIERIHNEAHTSGYEAGYQAGHEAGYQAGLAAAQDYAEQLGNLAQGLQEAMGNLDQEVAESLLACSLEVARQITRTVIQVRPEVLLAIIREALTALPLHHGPVTLLIHPDHLSLVQEHLGDQFSHAGWHIQEDQEIPPGGCRLQAGNSEVDATLPTRWRRTLEAIGVTPEWLEARP